MALFFEFVISLLAAFGLVCLGWLSFGTMVLPVGRGDVSTRMVVTARGRGEGLEQTISALCWLRRSGFWRGKILVEDGGLDGEGLALAEKLAERTEVELMKREGSHND